MDDPDLKDDLEPNKNGGEDLENTGGLIGNEITDEMPPVNNEFVNAQNSEKEAEFKTGEKISSKGDIFDPSLHILKDGEPVENSKGKWKRKRGRKAGSGKPILKDIPLKSRVVIPETQKQGLESDLNRQVVDDSGFNEDQARASGKFCAHALIQCGRSFGGEEWTPINDKKNGVDEKANLEQSFGDYFVSQEISDFPPSIALIIAVGGYALPRFLMPVTKKRTASLWEKFKLWNQARKLKKKAAEILNKTEPKGAAE